MLDEDAQELKGANEEIVNEKEDSNSHLISIPEHIVPTLPNPAEQKPNVFEPTSEETSSKQNENTVSSGYNLRRNRIPRTFPDHLTFTIKLKDGITRFKELAVQAIEKESTNMLNYHVWRPIKLTNLPRGTRILPSSAFLKEKFSPDGILKNLKCRIVAGGHRQDRTIYSPADTESPTPDINNVFLLLALGCNPGFEILTGDVESAYLNAPLTKKIFMTLDPIVSGVLSKMDETYHAYLDEKQKITVGLDKALYGCVESAKLWNEEVSSTPINKGFKQSKVDPCIFFKSNGNDIIMIAVYVDDFLVVSNSRNLQDELKEALSVYTVKYDDGPVQQYLGMNLKIYPNKIEISNPTYIEEILSSMDVNTASPTPASNDLFMINPSSQLLNPIDKENFHTKVAQLLYLSKRTRPDIQLPVSFLATRVLSPTEQDNDKLLRVLKYLFGTKNLSLTLQASTDFRLSIFVDASYANHSDFKSHTGSVVRFGQSTLGGKSTKQKINTKSSCEAELVSVSETIGEVLKIKSILNEMGFNVPPPVLMQDNKSTIILLERGRPASSQTRHIGIKFFFTSDLLSRKEITIQYCPTEDMIADLLTKPLQGNQFIKLRNWLLGIASDPVEGSVADKGNDFLSNWPRGCI